MVEQGPQGAVEQGTREEAESEGFDLEQAKEVAGFVARAARRRPKLAIFTFVGVAAVGLTVAVTMPRTYTAQVKLLTQRSTAIRVLSGNAQMDGVDAPTRNISALIMRRDNLVALAKDTHLVERFETTRPAALRFKDRVMGVFGGPPSEEGRLMAMVFTLEKVLDVSVDDATVTISVDWSNPRIAYDLVTLVQKNFLEARYDSDVAVINDSLAVLEDHAKTELEHVDEELSAYQKIFGERSAAAAAAIAKSTPRTGPTLIGTTPRLFAPAGATPAWAPDPEAAKALEEKRLQIRAIEDVRQHAIENLKGQLMQLQLTLTPQHPQVMALQQQLEAVSQTPPELAQMRSEERALMAQLVPPRLPASSASAAASPAPFRSIFSPPAADAGLAEPDLLAAAAPSLDRDGPLQLEQTKLASAIGAYEDVMRRIDAARVELDITRAAYKYKYTVVTPAELPTSPKKATARMIAMVSLIGAVVLALLVCAGLDLLKGSIIESWQIRRRLKLEIVGELDRPA
jgi:uncharacterized protein involved in exopolysaccharide biosynthesis